MIEVMIFKDKGLYNRNLKNENDKDVFCCDIKEAKELTKDIELAEDEYFVYWNSDCKRIKI